MRDSSALPVCSWGRGGPGDRRRRLPSLVRPDYFHLTLAIETRGAFATSGFIYLHSIHWIANIDRDPNQGILANYGSKTRGTFAYGPTDHTSDGELPPVSAIPAAICSARASVSLTQSRAAHQLPRVVHARLPLAALAPAPLNIDGRAPAVTPASLQGGWEIGRR